MYVDVYQLGFDEVGDKNAIKGSMNDTLHRDRYAVLLQMRNPPGGM
jgi:hypothetical protein